MRGAERKVVGGARGAQNQGTIQPAFSLPHPQGGSLDLFLFFPGGKVALPQFFIDIHCSLNS